MIAHISDDGFDRKESVAEHTEKTAFLCGEKGKRCGLAQLMTLCGILHDMGKNKQSFHDYLCADEETRRKRRGTVAHASTGAKYVYDRFHGCGGSARYMTEMISYAIAAHHGVFDCVDAGHHDVFSQKLDSVDAYDEACRNAEQDYLGEYDLVQMFGGASDEFQYTWDQIKESYMQIKHRMFQTGKAAPEKARECKSFLLSCLQRLILSILIDSDWEATSDFMSHVDSLSKQTEYYAKEIFEKAGAHFARYMKNKRSAADLSRLTDKEKSIFDARNRLQEECRKFAEHPAGIYCLPIPTGGGKTLSSLAYALEFCRLHPETERIIYVSPYISITEQNAKVFRDAVGNDDWILEHHSSVIRDEKTESEDYRSSKLSKYEINWEEPFICTTFVQFMNTLFSDRSESIRRMHRLINAVVIIDEVQSMPLKCIHTFNYMIDFLNAVCNTNIILCTATQPTLDETECPVCYSDPKYMIKNAAEWFRQFERVQIELPGLDRKYTFEQLGNEIAEQTAVYRSILVVLNTKSAVKKLYDLLRAQQIPAEYLTTNLCAAHRSDRIAAIKEALAEKRGPLVVVSTNLIEAGVDISFECVYRSMAGLDSLAQTAGRCNRNGEMETGRIYLIKLEDENTGNMEELRQNTRVAESVISEYGRSDKRDSLLTPKWMEEYYRRVYDHAKDRMNFPTEPDTNMIELLSDGFETEEKKNLMNQAYKTAGQAYRVIEDHSFGVIVPYKRGAELIEAIREIKNASEIKRYIRQAQRYTVNIREAQFKEYDGLIQPIDERFPGLYMAAVSGVYHMDYGIAPEWEALIF